MKKLAFLLLISSSVITVVFAQANFATSLKNCSSYSESGTVTTEGMDVTSTKQILGKQGDRCIYKETVNFSGMNVTTTCKFTQAQINEITSVINAYSLLNQYSENNVDTSSLEKVKNNPVVKVWNKYLQDSSTCTISGLK
jgi:cell fate (sporulation/competence/biofilm development) regulator YmcA (YheA/YmcA/DUF963 family)